MNTSFKFAVVSLAALATPFASQAFFGNQNTARYDPFSKWCVNAQDREAYNGPGLHECADLSYRKDIDQLTRKYSMEAESGTKLNMRGSTFRSSELGYGINSAKFSNFDLIGAKFPEARGSFLSFNKADLRYTDFTFAMLPYSKLRNADLRFASLGGAKFLESDFSSADLSFADAQDSVLTGVSFYTAKLVKTSFTGANLVDANLFGANCRYARFLRADLRCAVIACDGFEENGIYGRLKDATFNNKTRLPFSREKAIEYGMIFSDDQHGKCYSRD